METLLSGAALLLLGGLAKLAYQNSAAYKNLDHLIFYGVGPLFILMLLVNNFVYAVFHREISVYLEFHKAAGTVPASLIQSSLDSSNAFGYGWLWIAAPVVLIIYSKLLTFLPQIGLVQSKGSDG
jgi:hypothetical protein